MSEKKERTHEKRFQVKSTLGAGIICAVAVLLMLIKGISLQPEINTNNQRIAELENSKASAELYKSEVDEMVQNPDSDEYTEKVAREKLGMVKKDEIVFIDVSEK